MKALIFLLHRFTRGSGFILYVRLGELTRLWVKWARVLHNIGCERLAKDKHSSLGGPFVSYEENSVVITL
jgi:hypothetical protein